MCHVILSKDTSNLPVTFHAEVIRLLNSTFINEAPLSEFYIHNFLFGRTLQHLNHYPDSGGDGVLQAVWGVLRAPVRTAWIRHADRPWTVRHHRGRRADAMNALLWLDGALSEMDSSRSMTHYLAPSHLPASDCVRDFCNDVKKWILIWRI